MKNQREKKCSSRVKHIIFCIKVSSWKYKTIVRKRIKEKNYFWNDKNKFFFSVLFVYIYISTFSFIHCVWMYGFSFPLRNCLKSFPFLFCWKCVTISFISPDFLIFCFTNVTFHFKHIKEKYMKILLTLRELLIDYKQSSLTQKNFHLKNDCCIYVE